MYIHVCMYVKESIGRSFHAFLGSFMKNRQHSTHSTTRNIPESPKIIYIHMTYIHDIPQWNHEDFSILILNPPMGFKRNIHRYTFQYSFPVFKIGTLVVWPAVDLCVKRHTLLIKSKNEKSKNEKSKNEKSKNEKSKKSNWTTEKKWKVQKVKQHWTTEMFQKARNTLNKKSITIE